MDYIYIIKDSVQTSVSIKIFKNEQDATLAHIFKSKFVKLPLSIFKNVNNFNPDRLKKSAVKAYPLNNRPRGNSDISSVKYYQKQIQQEKQKDITPIWMIYKNKKYTLLDGAHRIVASYIEGVQNINAYVINI
jgi:hypothetical protein